ncbi:MAG: helix-turn-helix transcriptional regulator, partial [Actinomycetota bacterium]|nr:helix-turn-helix transcriptional regulator [Actinomycetota bacterium]
MDERSSGNMAATKLRPPVTPARLVDRGRLGTVLDDANTAELPLVLVCAPAGSGKSTLVAAWAATHQRQVAWLQLEESDADPARFWVSVTAAIGRALPEVGARLAPLVAGALGAGQVV